MIAEGGYGCVFHPSIPCKPTEKPNEEFVSKIVKYDFNAENEIFIGKQIEKIKSWSSYFNIITHDCAPVHISQIKTEEKDKCESFSRSPNSMFVILNMRYIEGLPFGKYLAAPELNENQRFQSNFEGYIHLLQALNFLIQHHIVHNDLKSGNILFSYKKEKPIIIDFGLAFEMKNNEGGLLDLKDAKNEKLYKYFYIYAPDYYIWAPEIHLINYLLHKSQTKILSDIEIHDIADTIVEKNPILKKKFSQDFQKKYKDRLFIQFKSYIDNNSNFISLLNSILKTWYTWDNYSLSIFYLKQLSFSFGDQPFFDNNYVRNILQLLLMNISPFSKKRLPPKKTIKIVYNWLHKKDTFEKNLEDVFEFQNIVKKNPKLWETAVSDEQEMKKLTNLAKRRM